MVPGPGKEREAPRSRNSNPLSVGTPAEATGSTKTRVAPVLLHLRSLGSPFLGPKPPSQREGGGGHEGSESRARGLRKSATRSAASRGWVGEGLMRAVWTEPRPARSCHACAVILKRTGT